MCGKVNGNEASSPSQLFGGDSINGNNINDDDDDAESSIHQESTTLEYTNGSGSGSDSYASWKRESQRIWYLRVLVVVVLVITASGVVSVVAYLSAHAQRHEMKAQYEAVSGFVLEKFMEIAKVNMEAIGGLATTLTDHGQHESAHSHRRWPFITLTSFERRANTVKDLSESLSIIWSPVVPARDRLAWEQYTTNSEDALWYHDSVAEQEALGIMDLDNLLPITTSDPLRLTFMDGAANMIYNLDRDEGAQAYISPMEPFYLPIWQTSPVTRRALINQNQLSNAEEAMTCLEEDAVVFGGMKYSRPGYGTDDNPNTAEIAWLLRMANKNVTKYLGDIYTVIYFPVHDGFEQNRTTVGVIRIVIHWARFFRNLFPNHVKGLVIVLDNTCDEPYTYEINGGKVDPIGYGDLHDPKWESSRRSVSYDNISMIPDGTRDGLKLFNDGCPYRLHVYNSQKFQAEYFTNKPIIIDVAVSMVFIFTIAMFFVYDRLVERRQRLIARKAEQTGAIVSSLFPSTVRDRLFQLEPNSGKPFALASALADRTSADPTSLETIADLFPQTTVLFADIAGFTSWSSSRGPHQVFTLLQTIYQAFDKIATRMHVFKVETIGDSYIACTGCPRPQPDHATIMVKFAYECSKTVKEILRQLETTLGPDTVELNMRFGVHSGPVTAGVLRGERSRFQLFGDTVNTAARMESTGIPGRIQASQSTADILMSTGKGHWVTPRKDSVLAKGKGVVHTYWITPRTESQATSSEPAEEDKNALRTARSIEWMTQLLIEYTKKIRNTVIPGDSRSDLELSRFATGKTPLEEVVEVINLKEFDERDATLMKDSDDELVGLEIVNQIRDLVTRIALGYRDNPFHNFEHACWVALSADKFMKRIVAPSVNQEQLMTWKENSTELKDIASHLYHCTHGLSTDPVARLAIIFSALIHDLDHNGVSNQQLQVENPALSRRYDGKSIAEQNSLDMAWSIFSMDRFKPLRNFWFVTQDDLIRFRQVLVNVVLATDLFDKELSALRRNRWDKAFGELKYQNKQNGLRATIVMEHIIQASDVSHTMQHWHVYQKWNRRLFFEIRQSYCQRSRMGIDPALFWYEGEIKFFDNYIIPLAKKLKECNVFGVSSDEVLNYAVRNRTEWEDKGKDIVAEFVSAFDKEFGTSKWVQQNKGT